MAGSFTADLTRFVERANGNFDKAVQTAVVLTSQGVIMPAPVDSGRYKSNWQFGKSAPQGVLDSVDKSGAATVARIANQAKSVKAGYEYWLVNNLPYAGKLEYGYSKQAPGGTVRITLANLPAALEAVFRARP